MNKEFEYLIKRNIQFKWYVRRYVQQRNTVIKWI